MIFLYSPFFGTGIMEKGGLHWIISPFVLKEQVTSSLWISTDNFFQDSEVKDWKGFFFFFLGYREGNLSREVDPLEWNFQGNLSGESFKFDHLRVWNELCAHRDYCCRFWIETADIRVDNTL